MTEHAAAPPVPVLAQLEQARLDNRRRWRRSGIVMLLLLIVGIGIPLIPVVAIFTLLSTNRAETRARDGVYGPPGEIDDQGFTFIRWFGAAVLVGLGLLITMAAVMTAGVDGSGLIASRVIVAFVLFAVGLAVSPWRPWHAPGTSE